jgi:hypothetical protein
MKPIQQTKFGNPEGNCLNACIASILECSIDDLPDLAEAERQNKNWFHVLNDYLKEQGYGIILIDSPVPICVPKDCYYIVSGKSHRGLLHSIIHKNGERIFDPHPDNTGILEIEDYIFIVKL